MTKKYLKINETAIVALILLIVGVSFFSFNQPKKEVPQNTVPQSQDEKDNTANGDVVEKQNSVDDLCVAQITAKLDADEKLATFEQYPIKEIYVGEISALDLNSSYIARRFKTYISEALKSGVNFAGHYVIAEWGFTGIGREIAIIDVVTGKAYVFPYVANMDFEYKKDSNLIIIDPIWLIKRSTEEYGCMNPPSRDISDVRPYYFLWENNVLKLLGPTDNPPPTEDRAGWLNP